MKIEKKIVREKKCCRLIFHNPNYYNNSIFQNPL
jgi:hypothetical protein